MQHQLMLGRAFDGRGPIGRRGTSQALDFNNAIFDNIFLFQSEFIKALELSPDSL